MTKDQLVRYLRVCADLADSPKDGIAHVAIVPLRQVIQLLESSPEPKAKPAHWHCKTHGEFDAMVAVGCPECTRIMRETLRRIAASHGASDHSCFRRDLADRTLSLGTENRRGEPT